jgi:hypothetical protein
VEDQPLIGHPLQIVTAVRYKPRIRYNSGTGGDTTPGSVTKGTFSGKKVIEY